MKNDTTFVRMRSGDHLGDAKVEKGHLAPSNLTFLLIAIDTNGFRRMQEEGQIYKPCLRFLVFALGLSSYGLSKFSDALPRCSILTDHN